MSHSRRTFSSLLLLAGCFTCLTAHAATRVALVADPKLGSPAQYGITQLKSALAAQNIVVAQGDDAVNSADTVLVVGLSNSTGPASIATTSITPESFVVRAHTTYKNKPAILLSGADDKGLMYAALDLADKVNWSADPDKPFQFASDADEKPFLKDRGVVMFSMNRAWFESRLFDEKYLAAYFDMLAQNRFNKLVLIFGYENGGYMAPLYPYFFNVDGFPDVKVPDLTKEQQNKNLQALKTFIKIAADRGIQIKPAIWDHIYRGGIQAGGISGAAGTRQPVPGIPWGLNAQNLVPYTTAALKKFYDTFPEFTETQFRMHEESGLTVAEIEPFWHDIFAFFKTTKPDQKLELRVKNLPKSVVKDAQSQGLSIQLDTKFWMEQMGLPFHPTHVNRENQKDSRQGYADFLEYPQTYRFSWTLYNGGTTRILLWSDPDYARRMAQSARFYDSSCLVVTEMQATKMLGAPHDATPVDYLNESHRYTEYEFQRYWAFYRVFGRLAYNPDCSPDVWMNEYTRRFGNSAGPHVQKSLQYASQVLPRVTAASVPYSQFPTTAGWPEMMRQGSLPSFAQNQSGSDIQQFMNVRDGATSIINKTDTPMRRPEEISQWFTSQSEKILAEATAAEQTIGANPSKEFQSTLTDVKMLAALARYHAARQLGGVNYNLYKQTNSLVPLKAALTDEQKAISAWRDLVTIAGDYYIDNMWFGATGRNFPHHWKDELAKLETEFERLQDELKNSEDLPLETIPKIPARNPISDFPTATFTNKTPAPATSGVDFPVAVQVAGKNPLKSVTLRYRHVNQKEDYETAKMTLDEKSGNYSADIPGKFITPQWDLMYFVEVIDQKGNGRMFPDLEVETPYIVVGVKR